MPVAGALPILKIAAPALISGAMGLFGNRQSGAEKQIAANTAQQSQMANMIAGVAKNQHSMAQPALSKAMQYYTTLASGNRGAIDSTLAPDRASLMDTYAGAERGINARTPGGPTRERQIAELYRQRAGQSALMPMMARQSAVSNLGEMGGNLLNSGNQLYGGAANILGEANKGYGQLAQFQQQRQQGWATLGKNMGDIFGPWLMDKLGGKGKGIKAAQVPPLFGGF